MEEVVYEDIQYKGKNGSLTLNDELLHYQAYPPNKTAVKCSLALLLKRQVSPKSASQQYIKLVTRSGKTATFYVRDRAVLEDIREDMRGRIDKMKEKRTQQKQREQQKQQQQQEAGGGIQRQQSRGRLANPMQRLVSLFGASTSGSANRILEDDELQVLKRKYAREIREDTEINDLQRQIQEYQTKLKQQRVQKGQMLKDKFQLEKDQMLLDEQTIKLKLALQEIILQGDEEYREKHESGGARNRRIQQRRDYTKAVQKATANNKKPSPGNYSMNNGSNNVAGREFSRKAEKEAIALETDILQSMHQQMVMQNQSSLAQKHTLIIRSAIMREKTQIDNDYAEGLQFSMVLEGTQNALTNMYPDIVLRLEYLLDKYQRLMQQQENGGVKMNGEEKKSGEVPHLILSPEAMKLKAGRRPSVTKSDGISDLGESLHRGRGGRRDHHHNQPQRLYHPPATMTTVHSLQQNSLSQMAGVEY